MRVLYSVTIGIQTLNGFYYFTTQLNQEQHYDIWGIPLHYVGLSHIGYQTHLLLKYRLLQV